MAKPYLEDGIWVVDCDVCGKRWFDPEGGKKKEHNFQCGSHHGIVKQKDLPEFQLPEDHKLNIEVLKKGAKKIEVEEVEEDE